jgi:hypothetical protein
MGDPQGIVLVHGAGHQALPDRSAVRQSPHPQRPVGPSSDQDGGAVWQRSPGHREHDPARSAPFEYRRWRQTWVPSGNAPTASENTPPSWL